MANKNKDRGTYGENYVVGRFAKADLVSKRTWGSDGRSMGFVKEVDVVMRPKKSPIWKWFFQIKKRKVVASYFYPPEGTSATIVKQDYKEPLVILYLDDFIELVKNQKD